MPTTPAATALQALKNVAVEKRPTRYRRSRRSLSASVMAHDSNELNSSEYATPDATRLARRMTRLDDRMRRQAVP